MLLDGDYSIIWKNFKNKSVNNGKSVRELVEADIDSDISNESYKFKNFEYEFKQLQISVPVNCEKWDYENYQPVVIYLASDYDEEDEFVNGFDQNGKKIVLSNLQKPDVPVIVVGLNERCDENGDIYPEYMSSRIIEDPGEDPTPPPAPSNLTAETSPTGILLNWDRANGISVTGYQISRKGPSDSYFKAIGSNSGAFNTTYQDNAVESGVTYSYQVKTLDDTNQLMSSPSNTASAQAPYNPNPPISFNVSHVVRNEAKLNWVNNNQQYILKTEVLRYLVEPNNDYELIATLTKDNSYYFDRNLQAGKKYEYMITHWNQQGPSSGVLDHVRIPFRDIQSTNPVYVKNISFDSWDLERWPAGKPEFRINVASVNRSTLTSYSVVKNVDFDFGNDVKSWNFSGRRLVDWDQDIWYDVLSLAMVEYDEQWGTHNLSFSAGLKEKSANFLELESLGVSYKVDITDDFEDCGVVYVDFYHEENKTYYFQNYGARITISNQP
ncbi:hypothetical protein KDU71_09515 [Carboxylicivirga sediminis]|uniref:Fibronectin type-III domain-containing protein n=1 Tax=Carboxylicivirga sediminis TaxID=2006564 RepID=A0A941F2V6_9BACT|nr:hypothetical protein [Carboxylicivirga sediminis]MBR8535791.1 hypothetical protein [Carboxylicivirga sediminis]